MTFFFKKLFKSWDSSIVGTWIRFDCSDHVGVVLVRLDDEVDPFHPKVLLVPTVGLHFVVSSPQGVLLYVPFRIIERISVELVGPNELTLFCLLGLASPWQAGLVDFPRSRLADPFCLLADPGWQFRCRPHLCSIWGYLYFRLSFMALACWRCSPRSMGFFRGWDLSFGCSCHSLGSETFNLMLTIWWRILISWD